MVDFPGPTGEGRLTSGNERLIYTLARTSISYSLEMKPRNAWLVSYHWIRSALAWIRGIMNLVPTALCAAPKRFPHAYRGIESHEALRRKDPRRQRAQAALGSVLVAIHEKLRVSTLDSDSWFAVMNPNIKAVASWCTSEFGMWVRTAQSEPGANLGRVASPKFDPVPKFLRGQKKGSKSESK